MTRILVVEDNEMNRDMLIRRLERRDFDVQWAVDGQEGVRLARQARPDLILLDIDLPVMDGWEAIRILKTTNATREIPVIALTAHAMTSDRERVFAAGFDEYGTKPVEFDVLMGMINSLLAAREAVRQEY